MRAETRQTLTSIVDTMTGADGGAEFAMLQAFVEEMDRRAVAGDQEAEKILDVVRRFKKFIDIAQMQGARKAN